MEQMLYTVLIEAVKQVPSLAVLCVVVRFFLSHLASQEDKKERRDEARELKQTAAWQEVVKGCATFTAELSARCEKALDHTSDLVGKNIECLGRTLEALSRIPDAVAGVGEATAKLDTAVQRLNDMILQGRPGMRGRPHVQPNTEPPGG